MSYSVNYLSKFSEDGYLYGKLVLFKNNEQIFVNHAKLDVCTGGIYSNTELNNYLQLLKNDYKKETYKTKRLCDITRVTLAPIVYPFVFIPYDVLEFHKITGFVRFDNDIKITVTDDYCDKLQQVKFIPVVKNNVMFEFSKEI